MSSFLILYVDENTSFAPDITTKAITSMSNAHLYISKNETTEGVIAYEFNDDSVNINIGKDWTFLAIEGSGNAALNFAIKFNNFLDKNLYLTDSTYSFLCQLDEINSIKKLENIITKKLFIKLDNYFQKS